MLERIVTIVTAVWFFVSAVLGILVGAVDVISMAITGEEVFGVIDFFVANVILIFPIGLILIYSAKGLDMFLNLEDK